MHSRLHRHDRALPTDRKPPRLEALRIGPFDAEVEANREIEPRKDAAGGVERSPLEILSAEPPLRVHGGQRPEESAHEIGDGVLVLADGEPGKFDPGRSMAVTGQRRIKAAMDPLSHRCGRLPGDGGWIVLRHGVGDIPGQLPDRAIADEWGRSRRRADAVVAMAAETVLAVDRRAGVILGHGRTHRCRRDQRHDGKKEGGQRARHIPILPSGALRAFGGAAGPADFRPQSSPAVQGRTGLINASEGMAGQGDEMRWGDEMRRGRAGRGAPAGGPRGERSRCRCPGSARRRPGAPSPA